ncbi:MULTISPECIES: IscS subfamily cysteine desulfurase [Pedobacter]|jgi:cysteine desulfurase|uniref:Cysteine desulfurase IscS n=2 Tax=Pedobacter TaxID=84567 RepID=A0A0T5VKE7_9SPHI|nr:MULTISPECIES: IscS subfamily cysteine desulfurase [Pedobacter]MDQ0965545.1 cysteine desulfurase [Flavobacterium sp. W4I14]KRT14257.1 cysteine desulfurase [Pedobacter ginsenosidimutans]MBT2591295.1 IscS subfamily cysteine desulfurase [Pedobacter sp. ISL-68]TBO40639.1 IscS subfamily cysteine desulfurase [Pedobacter kyonggii]CAH0299834.1 Cysteine desulfurase IscS [Pedobacter sp. Bi36]
MKQPIYLDNNATTPLDPRVLEAMLPYFTEKFGNAASRNHAFGWVAEEGVDYAREQVAKLIGCTEKEIIFTSGATEADNLAIKGVFEMYKEKGNHIITAVTEHKAVLDTCKHLEKNGARVTYLGVKEDGLIDLAELEAAMTPETILVSIMYGNNEIGVIQPVKEIAAIAHKHGALFMTDATQAVGKIPVDVNADGIDLMAFSAHKMYGPKGVGVLYVRRKNPRVKVTAQMDGGGHERGMRSGTLNVPGIVGLGKACELCRLEMESESVRLAALRDKLETTLNKMEESYVNGNTQHRLPHVANISFKYVEGEGLMMAMSDLAVSSGSACTSASLEPSYVLKSLGLSDDLAHSSIRYGLGRFTTEAEIDQAIEVTQKAVNHLRELSPLWEMFKEGIDLSKIEWAEH